MMKKLGFNDVWISRVMTCVSTASYAVLVNGSPRSKIVPTRGLRQGDPLSPYLYLICAEGLSCLQKEAEMDSKIKGVKEARCNPFINHLFFVDDSLIFCRANTNEWLTVQCFLDKYEKASR